MVATWKNYETKFTEITCTRAKGLQPHEIISDFLTHSLDGD